MLTMFYFEIYLLAYMSACLLLEDRLDGDGTADSK